MRIEKREIAEKLKQLKSVTPPKEKNNITGVLLANGKLTANNLDLAITTPLDVDSDETFVIPLKAIELIENLPDGEINVTSSGNMVIVKSCNGRSSFSTFDVKDFPVVADAESSDVFEYENGEVFANAVKSVMYACSVKAIKPALTGVLFEGDGEFLNIVACDAFRMAWNKTPCKQKLKVIIPKLTLQKVLPFCTEGTVKLHKSGNRATIEAGEYSIYTRLINGEFINYNEIFTQHIANCSTITINRTDMLNSISRSSICAKEGTLTSIVLGIEDDSLSVDTQSATANFHEEVDLTEFCENPIKIGMNPNYLIDCLKTEVGKNINISYTIPSQAIVVNAGQSLKHLVLPVRVKG